MNCEKFDDTITDLAREQMMDVALRQTALDHQGQCEVCAAKLEAQLGLTRKLKMLAEMTNGLGAVAGVERRVLATFRQGNLGAPAIARQARVQYWIAAAAAVLLIVGGVFVLRSRWFEHQQPSQTQSEKKYQNIVPERTNGVHAMASFPDR